MINIVGESSVGASNRRVESLVGWRRSAVWPPSARSSRARPSLKTRPEQLVDRVGELVASLKSAEKKIAAVRGEALDDRVPRSLRTRAHGDVLSWPRRSGASDRATSCARSRRPSASKLGDAASVVALAADVGGKPVAIVATSRQHAMPA
jgi:alanyl-tRNA synthetase